ncbi:MAG TPA: rRNA cytosine-C5-methyltransferase [Proteiniphilum sp.]|nr:rRNA cytosine-C5-methyltransferase [Proteiniphilum sp.]HPJ50409.1 rRNA cytosine-C5-methyltransferase [Proteiniphilum sp.]HPR19795.1 rRNA cytosine-C5-methyltransferase [Proteiniphilum sp.]
MKLPEDFILSMRSLLGYDSAQLFEALESEAPVTIRLNPHKLKRNPLDFNLPLQPVPWSDWGFYLKERPAFTFDPLFHAGYYYVQEASSMFVEQVARQLVKEPAICLDLCGAPGGKSVSLLSSLPEGSLLVSNELVRQRANILSETLTKYGVSTSVVTNNRARDFNAFPELFDLILVDAPCSGEGMFRKDPVAIEEWSTQNVAMCASRQKDILADVWPALKPGGLLVYSTCTFNIAENEENALWAIDSLGASFVEVAIEEAWGITPSLVRDAVCYRFLPQKVNGEGLFVTLLRKRESVEPEIDQKSLHSLKKGRQKPSPFMKDISDFAPWVINPERYRFIESDNRISALPVTHLETMLLLKERLKVLSMGISIGERKGKNLIPSHSLAMSSELNREAFICCELSYSQAVAFLRKEAITLSDATRGFVLLTYHHEPIGFVKNIGNRANNLYPNEWRIRSSYLPEMKPEILTVPSAN